MFVFFITDDDTYSNICKSFKIGGKPGLPQIKCTNKVILQIYLAKCQKNCNWRAVEQFFVKVFPDCYSGSVRNILQQRVKKVNKIAENDFDKRKNFFSEMVDFNFVSENLSHLNIGKKELLDVTLLKDFPNAVITNSLVVDLEKFRKKSKLPWGIMAHWLEKLLNCPVGTLKESSVKKTNFNSQQV